MPKNLRIQAPISSITAMKISMSIAIRSASWRYTAVGSGPTIPRKISADPTGLMIGSNAAKASGMKCSA